MFDKTKPMLLGDIFSNAFSLTGKTIKNNLLLAIIFLVPTGLLYAYGLQILMNGIIEGAKFSIENGATNPEPNTIISILTGSMTYTFTVLLFLIGNLAAFIAITYNSYQQVLENTISLEDALKTAFSIKLGKTLGFSILQGLVFAGIIIAAAVLMIILFIGKYIFLEILGVLILIAAVFIVVYMVYMWYFGTIFIIGENSGVMETFGKSFNLVRNYWWRTFGILLLISIIIQFALSLILTPISFILMWDFIAAIFSNASLGNSADPQHVLNLMKSFGFNLGIIAVISTILTIVIQTPFNIVLFFDLKIRKGAFEGELEEAESEAAADFPENTGDKIE